MGNASDYEKPDIRYWLYIFPVIQEKPNDYAGFFIPIFLPMLLIGS